MKNIKTRENFINEEESTDAPKRPYKTEDMPYFKERSKKLLAGCTKFTFKTDKPTGRYRSFFTTSYSIKIKNATVGSLEEPENGKKWRIRLMVIKDEVSQPDVNCEWKWINLKYEADTIEDAKQWLNNNFKAITDKWSLPME